MPPADGLDSIAESSDDWSPSAVPDPPEVLSMYLCKANLRGYGFDSEITIRGARLHECNIDYAKRLFGSVYRCSGRSNVL